SFSLLYSAADSDTFDPIIERIEDTFRLGKDCARAGLPDVASERPRPVIRSPSVGPQERSSLADRIARARGHDVFVVLRRPRPAFELWVRWGVPMGAKRTRLSAPIWRALRRLALPPL